MRLLVVIALFQIGWFGCALSAAAGHPLLGWAFVVPGVAWHLLRARRRRPELLLLAICAASGTLADLVQGLAGHQALATVEGLGFSYLAWFAAFWANFAPTLNTAFGWLRGRVAVAALLGAVFGPLAYLGAEKLGALAVSEGWRPWAALALQYAVLMPLLVELGRRFDGVDAQECAS